MRLIVFFILSFTAFVCKGQALDFLQGTWQGTITTYGQTPDKGNAIWFDFKIDKTTGEMMGECRTETPFTEYYAYKNTKGKATDAYTINFDDYLIGLQENKAGRFWCTNKGTLTYDDSTGYLSGKWEAKDCKRRGGEIIVYRSKYEISRTDTNALYHNWYNNFVNDLERGWNAYYVRDAEMRDFEFKPVLFDHDKDSLKQEFKPFLDRMVKIVESHSDLRIKIIGHTDSNGSDEYNIGLSERRAQNIKAYLISLGLKPDRIVIEYRGEKDPKASNATPMGKQLNRRVDFEFI